MFRRGELFLTGTAAESEMTWSRLSVNIAHLPCRASSMTDMIVSYICGVITELVTIRGVGVRKRADPVSMNGLRVDVEV